MIQLRNVSKSYRVRGRSKLIFEHVELRLPLRATIGVVGTRATGKTTLLKLLSGQEKPDGGLIESSGRISIPLGENLGLTSSLSGRDNTVFFARVFGLPVELMIADTQRISQLGKHFLQPIDNYSRAMRLRLNFALQVAARFDCYLANQQALVNNIASHQLFTQYFGELRRHAGFVIASNRPKFLRRHCDSLVMIHNKSIRYFDDVEKGLQRYQTVSEKLDQRSARQRGSDQQDNVASTDYNLSASRAERSYEHDQK